MGAFSKTLWITVAASAPLIVWTLVIAQNRGQRMTVPAIQFIVLVVGVILIWREGERISEAVTRVWDKIDPTRVWESEPRVARNKAATNRGTREEVEKHVRTQTLRHVTDASPGSTSREGEAAVFCLYCGYGIPADATFCRRCGRKQKTAP